MSLFDGIIALRVSETLEKTFIDKILAPESVPKQQIVPGILIATINSNTDTIITGSIRLIAFYLPDVCCFLYIVLLMFFANSADEQYLSELLPEAAIVQNTKICDLVTPTKVADGGRIRVFEML